MTFRAAARRPADSSVDGRGHAWPALRGQPTRRRDRSGRRGPRCGRSGCRPATAGPRSPTPPDGSPCSRSPGREDAPLATVGRQRGRPGTSRPRRRRRARRRPASGAGRSPNRRCRRRRSARRRFRRRRGGSRDARWSGAADGHRRDRRGRRPTSSKSSTSRPGRRQGRGSGGLGSRAGRPRRGTGRIDDPDLRPAAPARDEREAAAVGRPAWRRDAGRMAVTATSREPSASMTRSSLSRTYDEARRPSGDHCGSDDVLLRGGQLRRVPAAQREDEKLAGSGGLGRVGDQRDRADAAGTRAATRSRRSLDRQGPAGDGLAGRTMLPMVAAAARADRSGRSAASCRRVGWRPRHASGERPDHRQVARGRGRGGPRRPS